jgi:hypothetical protein
LASHRRAREEKRLAQAQFVSSWVNSWLFEENRQHRRTMEWVLRNGSTEPVYNCLVQFRFMERDGRFGFKWADGLDIVPPVREMKLQLELSEAHNMRPTVESMIFTDAAGRSWERNSEGRLRLLGEGAQIPAEAI